MSSRCALVMRGPFQKQQLERRQLHSHYGDFTDVKCQGKNGQDRKSLPCPFARQGDQPAHRIAVISTTQVPSTHVEERLSWLLPPRRCRLMISCGCGGRRSMCSFGRPPSPSSGRPRIQEAS